MLVGAEDLVQLIRNQQVVGSSVRIRGLASMGKSLLRSDPLPELVISHTQPSGEEILVAEFECS